MNLKRFPYRIRREVTYVEELESIIVAKTAAEAEAIAAGIGAGEPPHWPSIDRINTVKQEPESYELIELELVADA